MNVYIMEKKSRLKEWFFYNRLWSYGSLVAVLAQVFSAMWQIYAFVVFDLELWQKIMCGVVFLFAAYVGTVLLYIWRWDLKRKNTFGRFGGIGSFSDRRFKTMMRS